MQVVLECQFRIVHFSLSWFLYYYTYSDDRQIVCTQSNLFSNILRQNSEVFNFRLFKIKDEIFYRHLFVNKIKSTGYRIVFLTTIIMNQKTNGGSCNAHLTPGAGRMRDFSFFLYQFQKDPFCLIILWDFYYYYFMHVYSPRARGDHPWGHFFDGSRKILSTCNWSLATCLKKLSLPSDFMHIFSWFYSCI